jgi:hypothetical protein
MGQKEIKKNFEKFAEQLKGLNKEIEKFVPYAIVKDTVAFGNSSHIVLSKNFLDKKVGIIILGDKEENK